MGGSSQLQMTCGELHAQAPPQAFAPPHSLKGAGGCVPASLVVLSPVRVIDRICKNLQYFKTLFVCIADSGQSKLDATPGFSNVAFISRGNSGKESCRN